MPRGPVIERLIFFHLGRTGGTTLRQDVICKCAPPETIFSVSGAEPPVRGGTVDDLLNMPIKEQEKLRVIVGHMPFGLRERLPCPESWHYVTILRDPVARVVSDYYQMRESTSHRSHHLAMQYGLEELVRRRCGLSWNGICRWLANENYGQKYASPEAMLDQALTNLEQFTFVGLMEHYDATVRELCRLCGWKPPPYKKRYSLTPKGNVLSATEKEVLRASTQLDQAIYDRFRDRFLQNHSESSRVRFPLLNKLLGSLWPAGSGRSVG